MLNALEVLDNRLAVPPCTPVGTAGGDAGASERTRFLEELFAGKPDDLYILLWTLSGKQSHWFRDVESAIRFAESRRGQDLYVGVGLSGQDYGLYGRCLSDKVAGIVGLGVDLDIRSDAHPNPALPATIEDALKILPVGFPPPSFLIRTGNGLQGWWLFKEPLIFENAQERADGTSLVARWQKLHRLNAASNGWTFDCLSDLARVLRVPGTQNCKDPANPRPVTIQQQTERRYDPSDFAEYLDDQGIPDDEASDPANQAWKENFANKPLNIDPSATVADDLLHRCIHTDPRFQKTWLRQRDDLKDQSQSGYDLALANFGFAAGLSEQQVMDLIIHHRRIHSERPRTRLDYFQRTIAKAFNRTETMTPNNSFEAPASAASPQTKPAPATTRALLCEEISNAIGVRVLRIVKVDGQEPTYRLELEAAKIVFASVDKLVGQHSFRMKIASAVEHLVPKIPGKVWDRVAQMILKALVIEDGGDEVHLVGAARMYVESYLSVTPFIDPEVPSHYQIRSKPAVYEQQIAICSGDLQQHINKSGNENRAIKEVTAMLSALGAISERLKRTKLRDQSRWLLPVADFPPDTYTGTNAEGL